MTIELAIRRLKAWETGKPLPRYSTVHVPVAADGDAGILAFVKMGGESAPWGLAFGPRGGTPRFWTVPEPRDRDMVAEMCASLAPVLLAHFRHPDHDQSPEGPDDELPLRQLWLPNGTHLDMLHHLNYAYTFTRWGEASRALMLNKLGRLAGFLFREAQRPGQVAVACAADALRDAYTFPCEDIRQAHLGYLLAWLETRGGRDRRLAAATEAEQRSVATALDPVLERDGLEPLVQRFGDANRADDVRAALRDAERIEKVLRVELEHRWRLVERAIAVLESDPRPWNDGLAALEAQSQKELWYRYLRVERRIEAAEDGPVWIPSPETDVSPAAAAAAFYLHEEAEEFRVGALIHHDEELQREAIARGDALRGIIADVGDAGNGRTTVPMWRIRTGPVEVLRVRVGTDLCVAGLAKRMVRVRAIEPGADGSLEVLVEVTACKTRPNGVEGAKVPLATDPKLRGATVTLLTSSRSGMARKKISRVWERTVPGAWLTHASPRGRGADTPAELAETSVSPAGVAS